MRRTAAFAAASLLVVLSLVAVTGCSRGGAAPAPKPFTASATFGHEPTITFVSQGPPVGLTKLIDVPGTGDVVQKGDLIVAHYLGQVWRGDVFDSSYKRNLPSSFTIGAAKVIPGWDEALVGVKAGSRVLLSVPPAKGYGAGGRASAGIKGTDTIVFVVDLLATYRATQTASPAPTAEVNPDTHGVTVAGALGAQPTLTVTAGTPEPTASAIVLLARGAGRPATPGVVVLQFESVDWSNAPYGSSWSQSGLQGLPLGAGTPFDGLVGTPIGSRVLVLLPKDTSSASPHPALAAVVDLVAEPDLPK